MAVVRAFTLVELLTVIVVIAVLASMGLAAWTAVRARMHTSATRALVHTVATAMRSYHVETWAVQIDHDGDDPDGDGLVSVGGLPATPPRLTQVRLWDLNDSVAGANDMVGDGEIDGRPAATADAEHDGPFSAALLASGYGGFQAMTATPIARRNLNARGQPIDHWRRPLRIAYAQGSYGDAPFGVWSLGRDPLDPADDLRSWEP